MRFYITQFKKIKALLNFFGIFPDVFVRNLKGITWYIMDYIQIRSQKKDCTNFSIKFSIPMLNDKNAKAGITNAQYFYQDFHVASLIYNNNPKLHVDIGSRLDGFVAHIAIFRYIEVLDIREQPCIIKNVHFKQHDLLKLPENMTNYCDSISSLHAIEHFGLGRYGDPVDYYGHEKALDKVIEMLKPNGKFYFSVPIGKQRIEFNAHRIFSMEYLLGLLIQKFVIDTFSYVDDMGVFYKSVDMSENMIKCNYNCNEGCGIFELTKK